MRGWSVNILGLYILFETIESWKPETGVEPLKKMLGKKEIQVPIENLSSYLTIPHLWW